MKFFIVVSEFNAFITEPMTEACLKAFAEQGLEAEVVKVPGALEIPLTIQALIKKHSPQAVVALGCLIQGDTDHYRAICDMVSQGCLRVMLDHEVPIIFEVLMVDSIAKAEARIEKGAHAAHQALRMAKLLSPLLS